MNNMRVTVSDDGGQEGFQSILHHLRDLAFQVTSTELNLDVDGILVATTSTSLVLREWSHDDQDYVGPPVEVPFVDDINLTYL